MKHFNSLVAAVTFAVTFGVFTTSTALAQSKFDSVNEHAIAAIDVKSGFSNDGTMSVALESLADAPVSDAARATVDFVLNFRRTRNLPANDFYTYELVQELAKQDVLLMDPGYRNGPLFQEIVDRRPLVPSGVRALRDLFNDPELEPDLVLYVADTRCGQRRLAGLTIAGVATVCGAAVGTSEDDDPRSHQVAVHEAAHSVIFNRYHRFRGYSDLVEAAQSIFGDLPVHGTLHINEFFGLAAEILAADETVWKHTLTDLLQTELHLPVYLPEFVASREHQHSLGYAVFYKTVRALEEQWGVKGEDDIKTLVGDAYDGPRSVDHFKMRTRAERYVELNIDEKWQKAIIDAYRETAHSLVAWLEDNAPDPRIYEGDQLYAQGDGIGAVKAWSAVEGQAQGEAYNSIRSVYAWGGRGVTADADESFKWLWAAIRAGSESAAISTIHADQARVLPSLAAIEDAIRLYGDSVDLLIGRSQMFERLGMYEKAEADLELVRSRLVGEPTGMNTLGYFLAETDRRIPEAIEMLEEANDLTQGYSPYIMDSLGWALFRGGQLKAAQKYLEGALKQLKDDQAISAHLGEVLWELGKKDEAREVWRKVDRSTPTPNYEERTLRETISRLTSKSE